MLSMLRDNLLSKYLDLTVNLALHFNNTMDWLNTSDMFNSYHNTITIPSTMHIMYYKLVKVKFVNQKRIWSKIGRNLSLTCTSLVPALKACVSMPMLMWTINTDSSRSILGFALLVIIRKQVWMGCECKFQHGCKNWQFNISLLRFQIYSLKLQHSHLFSDYC